MYRTKVHKAVVHSTGMNSFPNKICIYKKSLLKERVRERVINFNNFIFISLHKSLQSAGEITESLKTHEDKA
jgi:hypothetical protein